MKDLTGLTEQQKKAYSEGVDRALEDMEEVFSPYSRAESGETANDELDRLWREGYSDGVQPAPAKVATTILYAIAYDKEETRGDSDFNIDTCVEYNGESFKDLVKKFGKEFPGMDKKSIVGFWIVPESVKKVSDNSYFNVCGNDSAVYAQNAIMKGIAKGNAVKIVVKGSK